jgi:hypothetical protein
MLEVLEAELVVGDPAITTTLRALLDAASFATGKARRDGEVQTRRKTRQRAAVLDGSESV